MLHNWLRCQQARCLGCRAAPDQNCTTRTGGRLSIASCQAPIHKAIDRFVLVSSRSLTAAPVLSAKGQEPTSRPSLPPVRSTPESGRRGRCVERLLWANRRHTASGSPRNYRTLGVQRPALRSISSRTSAPLRCVASISSNVSGSTNGLGSPGLRANSLSRVSINPLKMVWAAT
jgi:hypothetical protein